VARQPVSQSVCVGKTARLAVAATGADLTFQWAKDGTALSNGGNIRGADGPVLTVTPASVGSVGGYACTVVGACGTVRTDAVQLTLVAPPCPAEDNGIMLEAADVNAGGGPATSGELGSIASSGQAGGVGILEAADYRTSDGFWAVAGHAWPVAIVPADFDQDGDVDGDDLAHWAGCVTGPELGPPGDGCQNADLDHDDDVDQCDFGLLQRCLSGAGVPTDPDCWK